MIVVSLFGFLAVSQLAASATQNPSVTDCSGLTDPVFEVKSMTISNAKLGEDIQFEADIVVNQVVSDNPVIQLSFAKSDGSEIPCIEGVLPCELKVCDGTTDTEKALGADWGNQCPIQPGTYTIQLTYKLPGNPLVKLFLGDGNIIMTLNVEDNGQLLGCVSYPVSIDVQ